MTDGAEGYFPRGTSILRRVQRERAVGLLYGQRALMLGALNPLAFIGTTQRSKAHDKPWKRLTHTAQMFEAVFFGSREQADKALAFTHRLHERVVGEIPEAAGAYPAGTRYSALDPQLMLWVVAPMYDSARVLYEALVRPLAPIEREQLWQEYLRFGELFGMPGDNAPRTAAALDAWWEQQLDSDKIFLTERARAVGRAIRLKLPVPTAARPIMRGANLILTGSLAPRVREHYGLRWMTTDDSPTAPSPKRSVTADPACRAPSAAARACRSTTRSRPPSTPTSAPASTRSTRARSVARGVGVREAGL
jgi:uncharacterized protein (DUF2236 family)